MVRTQCIRHPAEAPLVIIHQWQSDLFYGDKTKSALLSVFEYWHGIKLAHAENNNRKNLIQSHSQPKLEADLLGIAKRRTISLSLKALEEEDYIDIIPVSANETGQYLFKPAKVQMWVDYWNDVYRDHKDGEHGRNPICIPPNLSPFYDMQNCKMDYSKMNNAKCKNEDPVMQKEIHIENTSLENTTETTSRKEEEDFTKTPSGKAKPGKKQKDMASQNKTRKTKPLMLTDDQIQMFIDLYHQEKPDKWKPVIAPRDITPALKRNLSLLVQEYGDESMDKLRKTLMIARTHKFWSDCEMKLEWVYRKPHHNINNPNKIAIILDTVSEEDLARLDRPIAAHIQTPQDDKRARILERTARVAFNQPQGVVA